MKINSVGTVDNINKNKTDNSNNQHQSSPNFKGLLDLPGAFMSGIENGGFVASFLVQDTLGMTVPRSGEGLLRGIDRDRVKSTWNVIKAKATFRQPKEEDKAKMLHLKDLNFKEGAEVLIREGLSGPFMMFTPMLVLFAGKKLVGKSTFTNSSMIKRLGKNMTELVSSKEHDSVGELKKDFYRKNITKMVKATTQCGNEAAEQKFIDDAVASLEKMDEYTEKMANSSPCRKRKLSKLQKREQAKLLQGFNDFHKTNSTDYNMLNRVNLDGEIYSTEKALNGIRAYANDVLKNKNIEDISVKHTEYIEKKSLVSRALINATAALSTIGSLSIVPMLYKLVNPVPPGALGDPKTADEKLEASKLQELKKEQTPKNNGNVSFTGRYDKFTKLFEFNGNQLTPAIMLSLAGGGLMLPRVSTAAKRAPENPVTKKKDYSEIPEIMTRDIISTGAVTFGVPMLSKALINGYEDKSGFVLLTKPKEPLKGVKKVLDMLNPFSGFGPRELKDLDQIYGNIDNIEKLNTFSRFIDNNNGNLAKILKTEKRVASVFAEHGLDVKKLAKGDKKASNSAIIEKLTDNSFAQKVIDAIKPEKEGVANRLLKRARTLNSMTSFASTVFFVPAFLGLVLPRMVYGMTARRQRKLAEANQKALEQNNTFQVQETKSDIQKPNETLEKDSKKNIDYTKLNKNFAQSQTFTQMKHS